MPARKRADNVEGEAVVEAGMCPMPSAAPAKTPRNLAEMAAQVRALREAGHNVPEICEKLQMNYGVVNQLTLQSYKMSANTAEVFERQELMRLEAEAA